MHSVILNSSTTPLDWNREFSNKSLAEQSLISEAKDRLNLLFLRPESHPYLAALSDNTRRRVVDHMRRSLCFAEAILEWHDNGVKTGEDNSFSIRSCRGISASANERLESCLQATEEQHQDSPYIKAIQEYLVTAKSYLSSFGVEDSLLPNGNTTHINGEHHQALNKLARCALAFTL